jgi:2-methylisocitrate lyase-like PEP mutase family enzyme
MRNSSQQKENALQFRQLHHGDKVLMLPNIWDSLGASLLAHLGYSAIATASASVAYSRGYHDGEKIPFNEVIELFQKITTGIDIPVSADIEGGYADNDSQLQSNIHAIINTGIVGINFEDTNHKRGGLQPVEIQCKKISLIRKVSDEMGIPLFINARCDVFLHGNHITGSEAFIQEILLRGNAYKAAGADGFFPIGLKHQEDIKRVIDGVKLPLNISAIPGIPELKSLHRLGIARVSLGPAFLKIALRAMKNLAERLHHFDGLSEITENEITTDYLKNLVPKALKNE